MCIVFVFFAIDGVESSVISLGVSETAYVNRVNRLFDVVDKIHIHGTLPLSVIYSL